MIKQIVQLISMHLKEFFREPGIIFWAILFPILMAWGLGIAFTKKNELIRTVALVDEQNSLARHEGFGQFFASLNKDPDVLLTKKIGNEKLGITTYQFEKADWKESILMLKRGQISLIMELVNDSIVYHFDPLNPEAQLAYLQITSAFNQNDRQTESIDISPLTQTGTRYIDFLIPGLMAMGIMMSCMWGISYSLIDKRMKKLLRRMVATPMKKANFLIAQFTARLLLNFFESGLLFLFAYLYFDINLQGHWLALVLILLAGNLAFTGIAILVSSRTSNTQVGNGLINLIVMPMMILSGIFFSYHNFPDWAIIVIQKFPLTILADNIRSIFIEGAGLVEIIVPFFILVGIGLSTFVSGLRVYKWY